MRSWSKDIGKWLVHRFVTRDIGKCRVRESDHHCGDRGDVVGATLRMVDLCFGIEGGPAPGRVLMA